jgi:hypothetical protein
MKAQGKNYEINIDETALENIKAALKSKSYVKVGVLSSNSSAHNGGVATIALTHEFGSPSRNIPPRSIFRLTKQQRSDEFKSFLNTNRIGIFKSIVAGGWTSVLSKLGFQWVTYIHECFAKNGFGTWRHLKDSTLRRRLNPEKLSLKQLKKDVKILHDTGALENSIISEVVN